METITTHTNPQRFIDQGVDTDAPSHRMLYRRLRDSYSPTYLTILSVIQAVATGDLAQVVAAEYPHFTIVQWVLTLNTFGVLIITWNVFSVQSALWGWIPDVRDSAVPFLVGALELFLNHTIVVSLSAWLVAGSLIALAGAVGTVHITWRASHEAEHGELLSQLGMHIRLYVAYLIAGGSVLLALAWLRSADRHYVIVGSVDFAGHLALVVALLATVALGGSVYLFHLLWREAILYAQADQADGQRTTSKDSHAHHLRRVHHPQPAAHPKMGASR
jgi:hypothetical protein